MSPARRQPTSTFLRNGVVPNGQRDRDLPAAAMLPPGVQTPPRASQYSRPALAVEAIQRDRRGGDIRLL
ncbi:MAG: hypothetical protein F4Z31_05465 [Gemmatimonadetes bacterium]|nr:hypothetical protein [Gemmatimonadota bacterium]MYE94464.1 hypothetical protein [Gemmatimonadota bacterium]MYJ11249.1 hypothetical protein [Gemmatimonadota bacterium]